MPNAGRNSLKKSRIDQDRQQRHEQPRVAGAAGSPSDASRSAAEEAARRRRGKTRRHVSEDD